MAENNGVGGLWGGILGAVSAVQDLIYEAGELESFKKRVDELLTEFKESPAAPDRVGEDRLKRSQLGGAGFQEADFLYTAYDTVHTELENLSKVLGLQIESMYLAVRASGQDYDSLDEDIRRRMRTLNAEITEHYDRDRDPTRNEPRRGEEDSETRAQRADGGGNSGGYESPDGQ
ncbi:hypothetical protein [Streptomyces hebeiensis]